jgi:hypothetical protein
MYKWYERSFVCYAYLADVELPELSLADREVQEKVKRWFLQTKSSRWYTRGWTLQELIAPAEVIFYDKYWRNLGTREELAGALNDITKIPYGLLEGGEHFFRFSIAQRMSWASRRQTTRKEDTAYCLLGIMNVNMPLLYGEGADRAFMRLQEEILKSNVDESIFAWTAPESTYYTWHGLLASSPKQFAHCAKVRTAHYSGVESEWQITNRGLKINFPVAGDNSSVTYILARLQCYADDHRYRIAIRLMRISRDSYARVDPNEHIFMPVTRWGEVKESSKPTVVVPNLAIVNFWIMDTVPRVGGVALMNQTNGQIAAEIHDPLFTEPSSEIQNSCFILYTPQYRDMFVRVQSEHSKDNRHQMHFEVRPLTKNDRHTQDDKGNHSILRKNEIVPGFSVKTEGVFYKSEFGRALLQVKVMPK